MTVPEQSCGEAEIRISSCCGTKYVYCRKQRCAINPKGLTCESCKAGGVHAV